LIPFLLVIQNTDSLPQSHYEKIDWAKKNSSLGMNNNFYIFNNIFLKIKFGF